MIVGAILVLTLGLMLIYSFKLIQNGILVGILLFVISIFCIVIVLFPSLSGLIANFLGVGRGADLLLYMSFVIGLILFIALQIKIRKLETAITKLARHIAINQSSKSNVDND